MCWNKFAMRICRKSCSLGIVINQIPIKELKRIEHRHGTLWNILFSNRGTSLTASLAQCDHTLCVYCIIFKRVYLIKYLYINYIKEFRRQSLQCPIFPMNRTILIKNKKSFFCCCCEFFSLLCIPFDLRIFSLSPKYQKPGFSFLEQKKLSTPSRYFINKIFSSTFLAVMIHSIIWGIFLGL